MLNSPIEVLIVDDSAMICKSIKALINEYDDISVVGEASDGMSALEQVKCLEPDVVLMDLVMPGMDGIEAIQHILTLRPEQAIILLSAYQDEARLQEAVEAGAKAYLRKDSRPEDLIQTIRSVFAVQLVPVYRPMPSGLITYYA
jgi:DNA-binding NarL/FixJ family response regulator